MDDDRKKSIRRNVKDSVFVSFFRIRENVLDLYKELHPEDCEASVEDVNIRTVKHVIAKGYANDLGFTIGGKVICLVEAQSYRFAPMQVRGLFYLTETIMEYLDEKGQTVYNLRAEDVPEWEMYVVCTGSAGEGILRLDHITRNLFDKTALIPIQTAKNGLIEEYIKACHIIDSMADGNGKYARDAVSKALDACRDSCGRIGEFIYSRRSEIMGLYEQYFDEEENRRACMIGMKKRSEGRGSESHRRS